MDTQKHRFGLNQIRKRFERNELVLPSQTIPGLGTSVVHVLLKAPTDMTMEDVAMYTGPPKDKVRCSHAWVVEAELAPAMLRATDNNMSESKGKRKPASARGSAASSGTASAASAAAAVPHSDSKSYRHVRCSACGMRMCEVRVADLCAHFPFVGLHDIDASTWSRLLLSHPDITTADGVSLHVDHVTLPQRQDLLACLRQFQDQVDVQM